MSATITARRLQNAAARREADASRRASVILAKAVSGATVATSEDEGFTIDYAGRKLRTTPCSKEEVATFLRGNRVVDQMEIMEMVGEAQFNNLYNNGSIVRDPGFNRFKKNNLYWITTKACEVYGIPAVVKNQWGETLGRLIAG